MIRISLDGRKLSQRLEGILREYDVAGHVKMSLYGLDNEWLSSGESVPFIRKKGVMYWDVPIKEIRVRDLINTFYLNHGCDMEIDIENTQYWGDFRYDIPRITKLFMKYWKECKRHWRPWGHNIKGKCLEQLIKKAGVFPRDVLSAIWLNEIYDISEFSRMFSVSKHAAKNILIACGYWKKKCDTEYMLYSERREDVWKCVEKANSSNAELGIGAKCGNKVRTQLVHGINSVSMTLQNLSGKLAFQSSPVIQWNEPAYGERKRLIETFFIVMLVLIMLTITGVGIGLFAVHVSLGYSGSAESIYGFWGAIIGSIIAGLVTILTTYFIIHRSYKIDYHNERISVLPFFQTKVIAEHFSMEDEEPDFVKEVSKESICVGYGLRDDSILIEIKNVGHDIAFAVKMSGTWGAYADYSFQSIYLNEKVYLVVETHDELEFKIEYHDLYGNLYFQKFVRNESNLDGKYVYFESTPPELVNRTKRTRYCQ